MPRRARKNKAEFATTHDHHPPKTMNPSLVHLGLDIAKATLAGHLQGQRLEWPNTPVGHAALGARIAAAGQPVQIICEATGSYGGAVVAALQRAGVPVSVLQPARARQLACGLGYLAKTDALDAAALARIGACLQPAPTPARTPQQETLTALVARRDQLVELCRREKQHRETTTERLALRDLGQSLAALEKRVAKLDGLIAAHLAAQSELGAKAARLQQASGVGAVAASTLLAVLPELGQGTRARLTSLAGLAPRAWDSGASRGQRHVYGGRPKARRILYLCALSAARHHPFLKTFYARLRTAGKAPKVALTAVARKLLTYLHAALQNPAFTLA